jgi:aspartate kinase
MRVFKFGGASVKDAEGVKNVVSVLQTVGYDNVLLVVSAMGKSTNALEVIIKKLFRKIARFTTITSRIKSLPSGNYR